ncbi:MAG: hypothetical protein LC623_07715, partial [Halobacteriales archaeon]|nr:hypothetical protein [Halobacteriales archaeon]
ASGHPILKADACPCPGMRFQLDNTTVPSKTAWLELRVSWNGTRSAGVMPHLVPPAGNATLPQRGFDDWRIQSFFPMAGEYSLDLEGSGAYTLEVRFLSLGERRGTGPEVLPNLVTMVPLDIHVGPCDAVESGEQGAQRCLRLSNGIANTGDGPVEVHLALDRAATALVAQLSAVGEGRFVQWVYNEDGTHTERDAGPAAFHITHKHWHYAGLAHFQLFRYDPATGLRGAEVTSHHKQGFCFLDWGKMDAHDVDPSGGSNAQQNCQIPGDTGWSMGISRGYYDYYESLLTDEYVDVGDVPDGTYELVSTADGKQSLMELDPTDNSASIVLELHGDSVKLLEERGHYLPLEYPWSAHPA